MSTMLESVLQPALFLSKSEMLKRYEAAVDALSKTFSDVMGPNMPMAIRGLRPSDLGETNDNWAETVTAVANAYQDSQIADQNVPDDTVICLYGLMDTSDPQMVTAVRVKAGQGVRAEWDLFPIISSDQRPEARTAYAATPVVITKGLNVTISYYVRQARPQVVSGVEIVLLGLVAEKGGKILEV